MKFGIFDHLDRRDEPLAAFYDDRLEMAAAYESAGFYCYHIAEHHASPLGMAPSPNIFLAAVARRTRRLRFGPLVYLLPMYHPVRLAEEICMLDHLSGGRLDVGVGRGISPHEVGFYGVAPDDRQEMFEEALDLLMKGLTGDRLSHEGKWYRIPDSPIELRPLQSPHPPLWYGAANEHGVEFAARHGMNMVTLGSNHRVKGLVAWFHKLWDETRDDPLRAGSPVGTPLAGVGRHIFVADTDAEAERLARPAYVHWYDSVTKLWREHGGAPVTGMLIESYDEARNIGVAVCGSPATVRAELAAQIEDIGFNYLVCQLAWGTLSDAHEMRSLDLFRSEVMRNLADA